MSTAKMVLKYLYIFFWILVIITGILGLACRMDVDFEDHQAI